MLDFTVNGQEYRAGKISAREQFHIVRRLAPVLSEAAPMAQKGGLEALPALANALAAMPDESADYVLFGLLRAVQRKEPQGMGWSAVCVGDSVMFADVQDDMATMLQLAWHSLKHNLAGFFAALPSDLKQAIPQQSAPSGG